MDNIFEAYRDAADRMMQQQDWPAACRAWAEIRKAFPERPAGFVNGAVALMNDGKPGQADAVLLDAIGRFPDNPHVLFARANLATKREDWRAAHARWAAYRRVAPDDPDGYVPAAAALLNSQSPAEAAELLVSCLEHSGAHHADAYGVASSLLAHHCDTASLTQNVFATLASLLMRQPSDCYAEGAIPHLAKALFRLFAQDSAQFQARHDTLREIWAEQSPAGEEHFWAGLILGFAGARLTPRTIATLFADKTLPMIEHAFSVMPFHKSNVATLLGVARELATDNRAQAAWPPSARAKLAMVLAGHDFPLSRAFRNEPSGFDRALAPIRLVSSRLKIAVCVSGELRGYRTALPSWYNIGLQHHETDYFVHVWRDAGRKLPALGHVDRVFEGAFLEAYREAAMTAAPGELEDSFPNLFAAFQAGGPDDARELRDLYVTPHVVIEDETSGPFSSFSTPMKMYYKAEQAWRLAKDGGTDYDLIVSLRPNRTIRDGSGVDWQALYRECHANRVFFADRSFWQHHGLRMGDQFGAAAPDVMDIYATTYSKTRAKRGLFSEHGSFRAHANFAFALFERDIEARSLPGVDFGPPVDRDPLASELILELLLKDVESRENRRFDHMLIAAAHQDSGRQEVTIGSAA